MSTTSSKPRASPSIPSTPAASPPKATSRSARNKHRWIETAEATGGEAILNRNSLALAAAHILSTDSSSYTLTYSPQNFHYDGKWHNIRITLRRARPPPQLSPRLLRRQAAPAPAGPAQAHQPCSPTTPSKSPRPTCTAIRFSSRPAFTPRQYLTPTAEFVPLRPAAPAAKGTTAFHVDYSLSTAGLSPSRSTAASRATVVFAAIALDSNGERIGQTLDRVRFALEPGSPPRKLLVQQQIDLPKGGDFIALAVWDPVSGHLGTLQIPVTVGAKPR